MKLEILSFEGNVFSSDSVNQVYSETKAGAITILEGHASLLVSLLPSVIEVKYLKNGEEKIENFAVGGGVLEVSNDKIKILVDMLITVEKADKERAQKAKDDAEKLMEKYKNAKDKIGMEEFIKAEDIVLKSIAEMKLK
ncbi:ATP synthase F1 subunit epsilon [Candidatus Gracilibacteria bacterium]|nr:ATP synthase F1 subunit epsilon [Candidatus Gracilibacteria bacterium]